MSLSDKWKQFASSSSGKKAGDLYKKTETGIWKILEPVGKGANMLAGKAGAEAFWPTELAEGEIDKAARILRTFTMQGAKADDNARADASGGVLHGHDSQATSTSSSQQQQKDKYDAKKTQKVIKKIPASVLQGACGVAIFTCFRTGLGWSGAGGSGVVCARLPDGSWGPPSGILIHTIGWGLLIGLDIYDVVLVLRKPQALKAFEHPKVSLGGELSIAAGPVGNGAVLDSGMEASPCWSYTKSKGAYVGLQLDGTIVLKRDDANARFYVGKPSVADIFQGRVSAPPGAMPLLQTLYAAEGRPEVMGTQQIPQGHAPGDAVITEEEVKEMEALHQSQQQQPQQPQQPSQLQTIAQTQAQVPLQPQLQGQAPPQPQVQAEKQSPQTLVQPPDEKGTPEIVKQEQPPAPIPFAETKDSAVPQATTSEPATARRGLPPLPSNAEPPPYEDTAGHGVPHEKHT